MRGVFYDVINDQCRTMKTSPSCVTLFMAHCASNDFQFEIARHELCAGDSGEATAVTQTPLLDGAPCSRENVTLREGAAFHSKSSTPNAQQHASVLQVSCRVFHEQRRPPLVLLQLRLPRARRRLGPLPLLHAAP